MFGSRLLLSSVFFLLVAPCFAQNRSTWNGRTYSVNSQGRICNNPNCVMCNTLQARFLARSSPSVTLLEVEREVEQKFDPMPSLAVTAMLALLAPEPGKILYDLGCGDARIMIAASQEYRVNTLGVEINETTYKKAHRNLLASKASGWRIIRNDVTKFSLADADYVTLYLYPSVMEKIHFETLKRGAKVISFNHSIPGLPCRKIECELSGKTYTFFLHEKE